MTISLPGITVAILAANGFDEHQMTEIQRGLIKAGATTKSVAPETGVMNGWQGEGWGHYFPVDVSITEALGSDFDVLVIPGGERATAKLAGNLHARRIVNHFLEAGKPIAAIENGVALLALSPKIAHRTVAAPESTYDALAKASMRIADTEEHTDGNVFTSDGQDIAAWVEGALAHFAMPVEPVEDVSEAA